MPLILKCAFLLERLSYHEIKLEVWFNCYCIINQKWKYRIRISTYCPETRVRNLCCVVTDYKLYINCVNQL